MSSLMNRSHFEANARNVITEEQRNALIERLDVSSAVFAVLLPLATLLAIGGVIWMVAELGGIARLQAERAALLVTIAFTVGWIVACLFIAQQLARLSRRLYAIPMAERALLRPLHEAEGTLEWRGERYRVRIDGKWHKSVFGDEFLMPGIYDFYYLHGTDWVMSAKRLEGVSPDIHDEVIANSLAQANSLMVSALPMNRQGWLGVMQRLRLFPRLLFSTLLRLVGLLLTMSATILTAVILTAAILAGLYPLPALPSLELIRTDFNAALDIIWNSLAFLILIAFIVGIVWNLLRLFSNTALLWIAFLVGRVEAEEGLLRREIDEMPRTRRQRGFRHHYYLLGKAAFRVSDEAYEALTVEEQFRAYYLPARILPTQGRPYYILVNLEPLQESEREIILA